MGDRTNFLQDAQFRSHQKRLNEIKHKRSTPQLNTAESLERQQMRSLKRQLAQLSVINKENESIMKRLVEISNHRSKHPIYKNIPEGATVQYSKLKSDVNALQRKRQIDRINSENEQIVRRLVQRIHSTSRTSAQPKRGNIEYPPEYDFDSSDVNGNGTNSENYDSTANLAQIKEGKQDDDAADEDQVELHRYDSSKNSGTNSNRLNHIKNNSGTYNTQKNNTEGRNSQRQHYINTHHHNNHSLSQSQQSQYQQQQPSTNIILPPIQQNNSNKHDRSAERTSSSRQGTLHTQRGGAYMKRDQLQKISEFQQEKPAERIDRLPSSNKRSTGQVVLSSRGQGDSANSEQNSMKTALLQREQQRNRQNNSEVVSSGQTFGVSNASSGGDVVFVGGNGEHVQSGSTTTELKKIEVKPFDPTAVAADRDSSQPRQQRRAIRAESANLKLNYTPGKILQKQDMSFLGGGGGGDTTTTTGTRQQMNASNSQDKQARRKDGAIQHSRALMNNNSSSSNNTTNKANLKQSSEKVVYDFYQEDNKEHNGEKSHSGTTIMPVAAAVIDSNSKQKQSNSNGNKLI